MMVKKGVERKWLATAAAAYLLIMVDLLPSPTIASSLPAQHLPDAATGGSEEGKTGSPRKALGGRFKFKGAISLHSYVDFRKNKERKAVESRSLRVISVVSPPSPLRNRRISWWSRAPPPPIQ